MNRVGCQAVSSQQALARFRQYDEPAGDRRSPGAAVRLKHIAINGDGAFTKRLEVYDGAQRPANQTLDLLSAPALFAARRLACGSRMRSARQHPVFGSHPPLALAAQEQRNAILDTRGAHDLGVAEFDEHRAFRMLGESAAEAHRTQLIRLASPETRDQGLFSEPAQRGSGSIVAGRTAASDGLFTELQQRLAHAIAVVRQLDRDLCVLEIAPHA